MIPQKEATEGILLVDKPRNRTSFSLVARLRKILQIKKIGHAGTLDPFATGLMIMLIGRSATKCSDLFLCSDKEYLAVLRLGISTDTYDCDGKILCTRDIIPNIELIKQSLAKFQGEVSQIPPMFSAKKREGKKLYELARKGITVERSPTKIRLETTLVEYDYPLLSLKIKCSKGTYIRSIANDLGEILGCGAHLVALKRTMSGVYSVENSLDGNILFDTFCTPDHLYPFYLKNALA